MGEGFQYIDIVFLAIMAAFIFYKLVTVLGRRTGNERQRYNPYGPKAKPTEVEGEASAPRAQPAPQSSRREREERLAEIAPKGSPLAQGLTQIQLADRTFDVDNFLAGARIAYEMIVTAFAKGDRRALRPLLDDALYRSFEDAINAREKRGESIESSFVGIRSAEIGDAQLRNKMAEITVRFVSEMISCTKNADGAVIQGDPTTVNEVRDLWTFAREVRASDPNWKLIATAQA